MVYFERRLTYLKVYLSITHSFQEVEVVDSGVNTNMDLDDNYTKINSCISNLLEYCFVRNKNLGELDDEEISKAARHIRVAST